MICANTSLNKKTISSFRKLWMLWRERRLLWNVAWKTAVLSSILALILPLHYQSVVKMVPSESSGSGGMSGLLGKIMGGGFWSRRLRPGPGRGRLAGGEDSRRVLRGSAAQQKPARPHD